MTPRPSTVRATMSGVLAALVAACASCPDGMQVKWYVKQAEPKYETYLSLFNGSKERAEVTRMTLNGLPHGSETLVLEPGRVHTMSLGASSRACIIPRKLAMQCADGRSARSFFFDNDHLDSMTLEVMRPSCPGSAP